MGIVATNPFEIWKIRLQTHPQISTPRVGAGSRSIPAGLLPANAALETLNNSEINALIKRTRPTLASLYKTEGIRLLTAGAAAPVLGLALIDSSFWLIYGRYGTLAVDVIWARLMSHTGQWQRLISLARSPRVYQRYTASMYCNVRLILMLRCLSPAQSQELHAVFFRFAVSVQSQHRLICVLQTPIEVIKCRDQADRAGKSGGSFSIARNLLKAEGLRGLFVVSL